MLLYFHSIVDEKHTMRNIQQNEPYPEFVCVMLCEVA